MKKLIIMGSARSDGETTKVVAEFTRRIDWETIDLNDYEILHYDYEHLNRDDDFLKLMRQIIAEYDTLVFVTPVYWYAMSGIMKVFFDRITDLLTIEKELGRKLRGKKMAAVSSSNGNNLGDAFWLPFSKSAEYLGMEYLGNLHTISGEENSQAIAAFIQQIENS